VAGWTFPLSGSTSRSGTLGGSQRADITWSPTFQPFPSGPRTIIAGDVNAHGGWDVNQDEDDRGRTLEEWMLVHGMGIANKDAAHTRTNPSTGGKSAPDVTLCSEPLVRWLTDSWRVESDMGSDHLPVTFALPGRPPARVRGRAKWSFKKARWSDF
jgi:hypothetical protein